MHHIRILFAVACIGAMSSAALASPTPIIAQDAPDCDPLFFPGNVGDELGNTAVFPANEFISSVFTFTPFDACPAGAGLVPNVEVSITNLTNRSFTDLHYVSDPGVSFENWDGFINGERAVRIDDLGINVPLVGGDVNANLVFDPGETWRFVLDEWTTTIGGVPSDLGSIGVPSFPVPSLSTGSIVALPEPASAALFILGGLLIARRRGTCD